VCVCVCVCVCGFAVRRGATILFEVFCDMEPYYPPGNMEILPVPVPQLEIIISSG